MCIQQINLYLNLLNDNSTRFYFIFIYMYHVYHATYQLQVLQQPYALIILSLYLSTVFQSFSVGKRAIMSQ